MRGLLGAACATLFVSLVVPPSRASAQPTKVEHDLRTSGTLEIDLLSLDEPVDTSGPEPRRTAGWTAVPVAAEIIRRVAPLMGLRPEIESGEANGVTLARN